MTTVGQALGDAFEPAPDDRPIYQAGAFFPMPVVVAVSRDRDGEVNVAPYSLCFP